MVWTRLPTAHAFPLSTSLAQSECQPQSSMPPLTKRRPNFLPARRQLGLIQRTQGARATHSGDRRISTGDRPRGMPSSRCPPPQPRHTAHTEHRTRGRGLTPSSVMRTTPRDRPIASAGPRGTLQAGRSLRRCRHSHRCRGICIYHRTFARSPPRLASCLPS